MKHLEVSIGSDFVSIDKYPTRWWLVDIMLRAFCQWTGCRFCITRWVHALEYQTINAQESFHLPVDAEVRVRFAEWVGIPLTDTAEDEDDAEEVG